jgi:Raf kinase inhibitor-like YbhB/YbcL family protein
MAITCPFCGTAYDITLFQFGRGIRCDCGTWVDVHRGHRLPQASGHSDCSHGEPAMTIRICSAAFAEGEVIGKQFTGDGEDISPPLSWEGVPEGTKELALICDDPDAPTAQPWVHWVIYKLPPDLCELPQSVPPGPRIEAPVAAFQGRNSWSSGQTIGYRGPAPPPGHGIHHYHFRLYALDCELEVNPAIDKDALLEAMDGHILDEGELVGTYRR